MCCFMGPQLPMFYCIFKKEFSEIFEMVGFMGPCFECFSPQNGSELTDFEEFGSNHFSNSIRDIFRKIWQFDP